jgi:hypothetical protein
MFFLSKGCLKQMFTRFSYLAREKQDNGSSALIKLTPRKPFLIKVISLSEFDESESFRGAVVFDGQDKYFGCIKNSILSSDSRDEQLQVISGSVLLVGEYSFMLFNESSNDSPNTNCQLEDKTLMSLERFIIIGQDQKEDWNDDEPIFSANQTEWKRQLKRQKEVDPSEELERQSASELDVDRSNVNSRINPSQENIELDNLDKLF